MLEAPKAWPATTCNTATSSPTADDVRMRLYANMMPSYSKQPDALDERSLYTVGGWFPISRAPNPALTPMISRRSYR